MTGATGFIGGTVARQLRERGDEVVCLVRSPAKAGAAANTEATARIVIFCIKLSPGNVLRQVLSGEGLRSD